MAISKRDMFEALSKVTFNEEINLGNDVVVTPEDITDFIEKNIAQLDARNEKAKAKQAEKKAAGDALRAQVKATLGSTPMKVSEIVAAIDDPEVTSAKVVARLTQLVNSGDVVKEDVKIDGRTLKVYSIAE